MIFKHNEMEISGKKFITLKQIILDFYLHRLQFEYQYMWYNTNASIYNEWEQV